MNIDIPLLIGVTLSGMILLYIVLQLNHVGIQNNKLKTVITIIIFGIYLYISYSISLYFIRYIVFLLFGSIIISQMYRINVIKTICSVFSSWLLFLISEIIFNIIVIGIFQASIDIFYGEIIGNFFVCLIALIIFYIPKFNYRLENIINKMSNSKNIMIILLLFILALSFSIIIYINTFKDKSAMSFALSLIIIFAQIVITILLFIEKNNRQTIKYEYDNLLSNLEEYETMLDFQRVSNHENKNQLLVIKGMINKKENNKNVIKYIDSIVNEKSEDNESFLYQTNKIPSGGLRGLIYYKVLLMKDKKINVNLDIDNSVRKVKFEKLDLEINKDLCKIVGVILDNAIEAVENLSNRNVDIKLNYDNEKLTVVVSNNFMGQIDICNINKKGYSTKGKGHGYGLSLVKELIEKNDRIENRKEIRANVFVQYIMLNCKL